MNGNNSTAGSAVDQEGTKARLDELLSSLRDLKKTFGTHSEDSDTEWQRISRTFDSLMEERVMPTTKKEKVGEPSTCLKPTDHQNSFSTLGKGKLLKNLLEQRERLHAKERTSDREVISNLIEGKMLLAESFKTVINAICVERDYKVAKLEARYQELYDEYEELACDPSRKPSRLRVMMAGFERNRWSGSFEGVSLREALDKALAKGRTLHPADTVDTISDDDFTSDDEEELCITFEDPTVDRRPASVDRQGATDLDEEELNERFKRLWVWKPRPQLPEPVISTAQVNRAPQEEDGRPRFGRFLRKDNTPEAIYMSCMVTNCTKANLVKPLVCLIDTGASTNITSWNEIKRLGLEYEEEDVGEVTLVGGTTVSVNAVAKDVNLRIGGALVQIDLNIMPMDDDRLGETILGTGFLRSVGAVIDFDAGRISFNKIDPDRFHYWCNVPRPRRH